MKKVVSRCLIAACALLLGGFMLFAPPVLKEDVKKDAYYEWFIPDDREWEGIIRVWNIKDEEKDVGKDFLASRAKAFEKAHKGIYIELATFTREQCETKLQNGIKPPDVWFFPQGMELGIACDIAFEMLAPKEDEAIVSDFEFDVSQLTQGVNPPEIKTNVFCAGIASTDEKGTYGREFALEVAQKAADMLY